MKRSAGVLLHPTSLPGPFGVGDFGPSAERFLRWIASARLRWWQILPLGPPESFHSPYNALSAFALNPLLISPERLRDQDLLTDDDLGGRPDFPASTVDFEKVVPWKQRLLHKAWQRFRSDESAELNDDFAAFRNAPGNEWLDDWTLFAALRDHRPSGWWDWPEDLKNRDEKALGEARDEHTEAIEKQAFLQWIAFRQWGAVRALAHDLGIGVFGDLPIYVARNSAEVWARPHLFDLDDQGLPNAVAGVPPDDFAETGQLWGNPLYRWDRMAEEGYAWWIARLRANLELTDLVRIDHFRGFAGYWSVPADHETAEHGEWIPGPGKALFDAFREAFGEDLPIVAEDLGVITDDVIELRRCAGLPCMRVLHWGVGDPESDHAPHVLERDTALYTGTHDNETTVGWFGNLDEETRRRVLAYTGVEAGEIHRAMIRVAFTSIAQTAVVPMQDVLGLDNSARMNVPGVADGNWLWRMSDGQLRDEDAAELAMLVETTGRVS